MVCGCLPGPFRLSRYPPAIAGADCHCDACAPRAPPAQKHRRPAHMTSSQERIPRAAIQYLHQTEACVDPLYASGHMRCIAHHRTPAHRRVVVLSLRGRLLVQACARSSRHQPRLGMARGPFQRVHEWCQQVPNARREFYQLRETTRRKP